MRITKIFLILLLAGCSGGGGGGSAGGGSTTSSNKFTQSGSPITVDDMVSGYSSTSIHTNSVLQTYYGRFLRKSGSDIYSGLIRFTLNKTSSTTGYFTDFYLDHYVQITSAITATTLVSATTNLSVGGSYNASTNGLTVADASSRIVNFNLDFGNNTYFSDIANAGVIFTNDFNTMVGGDNASFFFIAQKGSAHASSTMSDLIGSYGIANFTVDGAGSVAVTSTSSVAVGGTGGNALTAFYGTNSLSGAFQGETTLTNSATSTFVFGYDTGGNSPATADGPIDGIFLLSPDKKCVLGYSFYNSNYFAASK